MKFNLKKLSKIKPYQLLIVLAIGVFLLVVSNFLTGAEKDKNTDNNKNQYYEQSNVNNIEKRLAEIVRKIDGIENADVFITYENNGVKRHASNIKDDAVTSEDTVTVKKETSAVMKREASAETPFVSEEILPQVRGVLIVASGADDLNLKEEISAAVSAVLGVPLHKVRVLPAK